MTTFAGPPLETEEGIGALTLPGLLAEVAARHADREALVFHGEGTVRWTYRDLATAARRIARALRASGLERGTRVAVLMGNRPEWVASAFGVTAAGGVFVPLNTFAEPPELDFMLRHCGAEVLLMQQRLLRHEYLEEIRTLPPIPSLRAVACLGVDWDEWLARGDAVADEEIDAGAAAITPRDDAVVIYTSGTTAAPKGALHAHRAPALQSWRFARLLLLDSGVRVWSGFPLFWTAGFAMVMGATLAAGGCLVLQEHFEPGEALRLLEAERVTSPHAWPHQIAQLAEHPDWARRDLSSLRQVEAFTAFGRHPTVRVEDVWSPRAAYGLTETFTVVTASPADAPRARREGTSGLLLPGTEIRILDPETGDPLPAGAEGRIAVRGPTLMKAYVGVPPAECFDADGFFRTGDAGYMDPEGYLHWTGRTSELIKTGGANVSPVEIELALLRHPGLKAALAVGVPDPALGEMVVVCAVPHEGAVVDEAGVRGFLRGTLASYKIPRRVLFFREDELSLTGNQKIRAEDLRALAVRRLAAPS